MSNLSGMTLNSFYWHRQRKSFSRTGIEMVGFSLYDANAIMQTAPCVIDIQDSASISSTKVLKGDGVVAFFANEVAANNFSAESTSYIDVISGFNSPLYSVDDIIAASNEGDFGYATASENLYAGNFVHVFNDSGVPKARRASNANNYQADGFVLDDFIASEVAKVFFEGNNDKVSITTPGAVFLGPDGGFILTKDRSAMIQRIGVGTQNIINFEKGSVILPS